MSKKIFLGMSAMAMLFATSCQDDLANSFVGEEATVEFNISTPEIVTRAFSDGMTVDHVHYAIYEVEGQTVNKTSLEDTKTFDNERKVSITAPLKTGKQYKAIFWADHSQSPYTVTFSQNGAKMEVNYTNVECNDERLDAFYWAEDIKIDGAKSINVQLKRPFAQINVGTSDYQAAKDASYEPTLSSITVPVYTTLNLVNGTVEEENATPQTFKYRGIPGSSHEFPVEDNTYDYLAMTYALVGENETADVTFRHREAEGTQEFERTIGSVPMKRNYRTNIYGALLTSEADVTVTVDQEYKGNENKPVVIEEVGTKEDLLEAISDAEVGGVKLTTDITIDGTLTFAAIIENTRAVNAGRDFIIDGNGKTLTYTGSDRAIDVTAKSNGANLTLKNLTIDCTASYCQRGINYNTNGTLNLDNVTVKGTNVTYALNLPGSSDKANVTINNSSLSANIALNVWGENMTICANNSNFISVDKTEAENYCAIALNNDGSTYANGTIVNIEGGSITAKDEKGEPSYAVRNSTATGKVNVSESTEVVGTVANPVAIVTYNGYNEFYSFTTLQEAIKKAIETNAASVRLITDIDLTNPESITIAKGETVTLDLNGHNISATSDISSEGVQLFSVSGSLNVIGNGTISLTGDNFEWNTSYRYTTINIRETGEVTLNKGVNVVCKASKDGKYGMSYAVDIYKTGKLNINGASLHSNYIAVRCFYGNATVNVGLGSSITSSKNNYGIWLQSSPNAVINIAEGVNYRFEDDYFY